MSELPVQTAEIFKILSKGQFISMNSADKGQSDLYEIIDEEQNFELLSAYFSHINFVLERGDGYFYFSRRETKVDLENKIQAAYRWIDLIDFFKTYDFSFGAGYRFSPEEILVGIKTNAELEKKLTALKRYTSGKENFKDILEDVLKKLKNESFIELENEISHQYKVLNSFKYLEDLILIINIPEESENEIPE